MQNGIEFGTPNRLKTITTYVESSLAQAKADDKFQFNAHGCFVANGVDYNGGKVVFNKITGLKDA